MGCGRSSSWPPAAPAVLLLLFVCFCHGVAAARFMPLQPAAVVVPPQVLRQAENNGATAAAAADGGLVVREAEAVVHKADAAASCEGESDECLERRLLGDAHLDYIYTQHKGKP